MSENPEPLRETLALGNEETPASFASRLAAMNWASSAREFCRDFYLSFDKIAAGDNQEIRRLAAFAGADEQQLLAHAPVRVTRWSFMLNGTIVPGYISRRTSVRICPHCSLEDAARNPGLAPEAAMHGRDWWLIGSLRTCPEHASALIEVGRGLSTYAHDFAAIAGRSIDELEALTRDVALRKQSPFEEFVRARLAGKNPAAGLLTDLPLSHANHVCERFGLLKLYRNKRVLQATEDELWAASAAGFEILKVGQIAIRKLFEQASDHRQKSSRNTGDAKQTIGPLHGFLGHEATSPAYAEIRRASMEALCELFPYGPEDGQLFGFSIVARKVHTQGTAALAYGVQERTLRKLCVAGGIGRFARPGDTRSRLFIDARQLDRFLGGTKGVSMLRALAIKLTMPEQHLHALVRHGQLQPIVPKADMPPRHKLFFRVADVEEFFDRLWTAVRPTSDQPATGLIALADAWRKTDWTLGQIISGIADGTVKAWGDADARRYETIRVDPDLLRFISHDQHGAFVSFDDAAQTIGCRYDAIEELCQRRLLIGGRRSNPQTGRLWLAVQAESLSRFDLEYVSLFHLSRLLSTTISKTRLWTADNGIEPAFAVAAAGGQFFRRSQIP